MQPHYVYSPRELTRWVRGICEAIRPLETLAVEGLVRLWAHEGLRLFQDRYCNIKKFFKLCNLDILFILFLNYAMKPWCLE